ncbi:NAD-dependent epimerase/dehydratase family protein [Haloferax gibbonsii]|uniref:Epimerase n=1 Tax=Haloferax gibbonsii TaxID=35746 RepID=A0A0K1IZW0_HALGI|nr:NAD(P)-dependent oxidoreductase [Haloferax gibbonsii]AKU09835.1 epimerase [Haloferax gibbonsii]
MDVLVTGAYGRCGTAIIDELSEDSHYDFTCLNRSDRPADHQYGEYDTVVADVSDYEAIRPAFTGKDAVVHLAGFPSVASTYEDVDEPNLRGVNNVLTAAREAEVESVVFASSNHVVGMVERENAPEIYYPGHGVWITPNDSPRPDSYYGASKAFGETLGRFFVENFGFPRQFYSLRICSVRWEEYDHPFGDAERGVENGDFERGTEAYDEKVARMKAMWHSRRDFAHQVDCCLSDEDVTFGIYNGVSNNSRRWFSLERSKKELGYDPNDDGDEWPETFEETSLE